MTRKEERSLKMKKTLIFLILPILLTFACMGCNHEPDAIAIEPESAIVNDHAIIVTDSVKANLREEIYLNMANGGATAVTFAVASEGEIIYEDQFGILNRAKQEQLGFDTVNRIGSISKVYTAAAIMKLVDDGMVNLNDPLTAYFPDFSMQDPRYADITVRMLLDHSSGMPGTNFTKAFGFRHNPDYPFETFQALNDEYLKHDPGYLSVYCNDGFIIAEYLIEHVSGMSYKDYILEHITGPLNMQHTFFPDDDYSQINIPFYYDSNNPESHPQEYVSALGSGGILSSAADLAIFSSVFDPQRGILSEESINEIFTPVNNMQLSDNPYMYYGLGFDDVEVYPFSTLGIKAVTKNGGTDQSNSQLLYLPELRLSVAIISQGVTTDILKIIIDFAIDLLNENQILDDYEEETIIPAPRLETPEQYYTFEGIYGSSNGLFKVSIDEGGMLLQRFDKKAGDWVPASAKMPYRANGYFYADYAPNNDDYGLWLRFDQVNEEKYIFMAVSLSNYSEEIPLAQMLAPSAASQEPWIDRAGKWLLRNDAYYSLAYSSNLTYSSISELSLVEELPGYILFAGRPYLISSASRADMCLLMPISAAMDLGTIKMYKENGEDFLHFYTAIFSEADAAKVLKATEKVIIESESLNQWRKIEGQALVTLTPPDGDNWRFIAFDHHDNIIYDSSIRRTNRIYFSSGGFIMMAGEEGCRFNLELESYLSRICKQIVACGGSN